MQRHSLQPQTRPRQRLQQASDQRGRDPQQRRAGCEYGPGSAADGRFLVGTPHGEELAGAAGLGGVPVGEGLGV